MRALPAAGVLGLAHAIADATTGFAVVAFALGQNSGMVAAIIMGYNLVAFGLQPLAGVIVDRTQRYATAARLSMLMILLGLAVFVVFPIAGLCVIALGSAFFHASGGALAAAATPGKSMGPGLFTAPGVVGLSLGVVAGIASLPAAFPLIALLGICTRLLSRITFMPPLTTGTPAKKVTPWVILALLLLLTGVVLRSSVWTGIAAPHEAINAILILGAAAGLGKLAGGLLGDYFGFATVVMLSLALSILFFAQTGLGNIAAGVFFLQASTPIILAAVIARMPKRPAFGAGFVLGLAIVLGGLFSSVAYVALGDSSRQITALVVLTLACFTAGFFLLRHRAQVR